MSVRIRPTQRDVAIGRPRLSSPDGAPCASGVTVDSWSTAFTEQPSPSPKYDARPDSWTTGLEFGASLLYPFGDATPTTALGGSYFGDIAW